MPTPNSLKKSDPLSERKKQDVTWYRLLPESDFYEWSDGYKKSKFYPYPVKREEFMSKVEEWGLKIEGLNVPMPPEQLAAKKKR